MLIIRHYDGMECGELRGRFFGDFHYEMRFLQLFCARIQQHPAMNPSSSVISTNIDHHHPSAAGIEHRASVSVEISGSHSHNDQEFPFINLCSISMLNC
jgi:hypothetical protein